MNPVHDHRVHFNPHQLFREESNLPTPVQTLWGIFTAAGPWVITLTAVFLIQLSVHYRLPGDQFDEFLILLVYGFLFSLILSNPLAACFAKKAADNLYNGETDKISSDFLGLTIVVGILSFFVAQAFAYSFVELTPHNFALSHFFTGLCFAWLAIGGAQLAKDYYAILIGFIIGMGYTHLSIEFQDSITYAFCLERLGEGLVFVYLVFLIRLIQRFGYNEGPSLDWLKGSGLGIIYLNTLLLTLTGMTDKLLYWFLSPHATEFLPGLSLFPEFDYAVFLTGLTLIPAIGYFHYFLDHGFHDHLFSYYASLEQGRGLIYLREQASKIYHIFLSCIGHLLLLHCVFAGLILVLFTFLFEYFSIGLQTIYLMKIASVNTVVQMAFQSSVLFLYYFNFQKESIRVNLGAFLTVFVVTLLMVQLPFEFTGFSFFLSIIPWTIFAFYKIERKLRSLTYYSISQAG